MKIETVVNEYLKDWVSKGREDKATHLIIAFNVLNNTHYPFYVFDNNIDGAWENLKKKNNYQPMISFNLNKKVLGVDS